MMAYIEALPGACLARSLIGTCIGQQVGGASGDQTVAFRLRHDGEPRQPTHHPAATAVFQHNLSQSHIAAMAKCPICTPACTRMHALVCTRRYAGIMRALNPESSSMLQFGNYRCLRFFSFCLSLPAIDRPTYHRMVVLKQLTLNKYSGYTGMSSCTAVLINI